MINRKASFLNSLIIPSNINGNNTVEEKFPGEIDVEACFTIFKEGENNLNRLVVRLL